MLSPIELSLCFDPALQHTEYRLTALMHHAMEGKEDCVECLLPEASVIEKIHIKMPGTRCTALHTACYSSQHDHSQALIQMLLLHGCSPYLRFDPKGMSPLQAVDPHVRRAGERTALDLLKKRRPKDRAAIAKLMVEPERTYLLCKVHHLNDANDAIAKAQGKGIIPEDQKQKLLSKTPVYLMERVEDERALPRIENRAQQQNTADSEAEETEEEGKKQEKLTAVLQYVLGEQEEGGSGKLKETPRMLPKIFVELLDMMAPHWDPIRGKKKEYEEPDEEAEEG